MTPINVSSVALAERYAREYFGLSLPITTKELKSAFRAAAKRLHTDTSSDASTKNEFIAMKNAYDFLVKLDGMQYVYGNRADRPTISLVTTDGAPLYELGLGLGAMKNGRPCEHCAGNGYTKVHDSSRRVCLRCDLLGVVIIRRQCKPCNSTGRFRQRRTGKIVPCRVCDGLGGKVAYETCPECKGTRRIGGEQCYYHRCYECGGSGEIELFSPLFPKGRFINKQRG